MLFAFALIALLPGQVPAASDPLSDELQKLVKADQEDRQFILKGTGKPTAEQQVKMRERDKTRFKRVNEILEKAPTLTTEGINAAALLMQHGSTLESFVRAHELSACASFLGKPASLIAASEDRYLMNLKRKQRFGAQFVGSGNAAKVYQTDEAPPTAVTDSLRAIYFEPPLEVAKKEGFMAAFKHAQAGIVETMTHRMDSNWIKEHSDMVVSDELATLPASPDNIVRVLDVYGMDKLVSDADYLNAGRILLSSSKSEELLLAHELVTVAFKEGSKDARQLFEQTWDKFEVSIGHPARYSKHSEPKCVRAVLEG